MEEKEEKKLSNYIKLDHQLRIIAWADRFDKMTAGEFHRTYVREFFLLRKLADLIHNKEVPVPKTAEQFEKGEAKLEELSNDEQLKAATTIFGEGTQWHDPLS